MTRPHTPGGTTHHSRHRTVPSPPGNTQTDVQGRIKRNNKEILYYLTFNFFGHSWEKKVVCQGQFQKKIVSHCLIDPINSFMVTAHQRL